MRDLFRVQNPCAFGNLLSYGRKRNSQKTFQILALGTHNSLRFVLGKLITGVKTGLLDGNLPVQENDIVFSDFAKNKKEQHYNEFLVSWYDSCESINQIIHLMSLLLCEWDFSDLQKYYVKVFIITAHNGFVYGFYTRRERGRLTTLLVKAPLNNFTEYVLGMDCIDELFLSKLDSSFELSFEITKRDLVEFNRSGNSCS